MSPDVHALTGAYVLDAVSELERAAFERHLAECEACAQEVRELRETAARLGQAAAASAPPPVLKDRVLASVSRVRQLPPDIDPATLPSRRRWALRLTSAAAAVLLVASVVLGVLLVRERQVADETRALASILSAQDARVVSGSTTSGGTATVVVSHEQGRATVLAAGMPTLPEGRVYQAWLLDVDRNATSAGLMADGRVNVAALGDAASIALTEEPAGGSPQPTTDPIVFLEV